jgi:hypothetical protein
MAAVTLGGRAYDIAPFRLRELRRAAPHIDRLAARQGPPTSVAAVAETAADMLAVLAAGLPEVSPGELEAAVSLDELDQLRAAFEAVMAEAGLHRGASAPGEAAGAVAAPS